MKILLFLFNLNIAILLASCGFAPQEEDFIGTWEKSDGGVINLYADHTCKVEHVDFSRYSYFGGGYPMDINGTGRWELRDNNGAGQSYYNVMIDVPGTAFREMMFLIGSEHLFLKRPPWSLFVYLNGPDNSDQRYEFYRVDHERKKR